MATSGSVNYTQTRNEVILDAFGILNIYGVGRTVSSDDMSFANSLLNKMVKAWMAKGLQLWARQEYVLYITPYEGEYSLGNASTDAYFTLKSDEVITQLNGAAASGASSITVDSTTGMATSDNVGVVLSDKTIFWTTISSKTSTTITLASTLTGAASDNAYVYTFTSRAPKPNRILAARCRTGIDSGSTSNILDIPMSNVPYESYVLLPTHNATSSAVFTQFSYSPSLSNTSLYIFPRPSDGSYRMEMTGTRMLEDLDASGDNFDFPPEWLEALTYQLCLRLARPFGKAAALADIAPMAGQMLKDLLNYDQEISEVSVSPEEGY